VIPTIRRELVERARSGDREAFASVAAQVVPRLFNIAQLMLQDRDAADDAVQETLVLVWRDLRGLRDVDAFEAWLHRLLVRSVYREAARGRRGSVTIPGPESMPDGSVGLANRDSLERGFRRLRPEHRAVLVLRHYLGFTDAEAAAALSVPTGTIKSRLSRATSALRSELESDARGLDRSAMEAVR
jgi:RNA polymerase sigma-70 factor (ECF subfamily)